MKKWICSLLLLVCLLPASSCQFANQPCQITLITKSNFTVDFWQSIYDGAQAAADVYGIELTWLMPSSEENYQEQIDFLADAKEANPDAILLAASDSILLADPVQEVIDANIPVIMIDSNVNNENTVAYVGTDNEALGALLAKSVCDRVDREGDVAIVSFVKDSHTAELREQGFRDGMTGNENLHLLDTLYCKSDAELARRLTIQTLMENTDIVAIAALNDPSIEGVCEALTYFPDRDIQVFSIDCTPKQVPFIENGTLDVAILQNPYQMGYYAVETAYQYLQGDQIQENIYTDIYAADINSIFDDLYQQLIFPFE